MAHANRLVGFPYYALREACWSEHAENIVIVDYDLLAQRPAEVIGLLYDFIGQPHYEHDFENVEYDAPAFDDQLGVGGLHRVRPAVRPAPRDTILPPDLFERYAHMTFWRDLQNCRAFRIVQQPGADAGAR